MIQKVLLTLLTLLLFAGCDGDNSYNGENLIGTEKTSSSIKTIHDEIIMEDIERAYATLLSLKSDINSLTLAQNTNTLRQARAKFLTLLTEYKRVSAFYIASKIHTPMLQPLLHLEWWHYGKNLDIPAELDTIFADTNPLETSLFKNSNKSITSLEYTLFDRQLSLADMLPKMTQRRADGALIITNKIIVNMKRIKDFYAADKVFLSNTQDALSMCINVLNDGSYKLREWRLGDAAGYTSKYLGNPDASRLEYFASKKSLQAIKNILNLHKDVMSKGLYELAKQGNAQSEADAINTSLDNALNLCDGFAGPLEDNITSAQTQLLYNEIKVLQNNYIALINGMNFTQDIIEADGD